MITSLFCAKLRHRVKCAFYAMMGCKAAGLRLLPYYIGARATPCLSSHKRGMVQTPQPRHPASPQRRNATTPRFASPPPKRQNSRPLGGLLRPLLFFARMVAPPFLPCPVARPSSSRAAFIQSRGLHPVAQEKNQSNLIIIFYPYISMKYNHIIIKDIIDIFRR